MPVAIVAFRDWIVVGETMRARGWTAMYLTEYAAVTIVLTVGLSGIALVSGMGSPVRDAIPSLLVRRLLTATIFAGAITAMVYSMLGRRSGGHLNPALTIAFQRLGKMSPGNATGYVVAQLAGALTAALLVRIVWRDWALSVHVGASRPGRGGTIAALGIEILLTFLLVTLILEFVDHERIAKFTGIASGLVLVGFVLVAASVSGPSFNTARSFGPAVVGGALSFFWIYAVAPTVGAFLAVTAFRFGKAGRTPPCAKLYHTDDVACHFPRCRYRERAGRSV